jgi:hypothetical protein
MGLRRNDGVTRDAGRVTRDDVREGLRLVKHWETGHEGRMGMRLAAGVLLLLFGVSACDDCDCGAALADGTTLAGLSERLGREVSQATLDLQDRLFADDRFILRLTVANPNPPPPTETVTVTGSYERTGGRIVFTPDGDARGLLEGGFRYEVSCQLNVIVIQRFGFREFQFVCP